MKYVLMFTCRPDLNATVDPDGQAVYKKVYEWFAENGDEFADSGAELHGIRPRRPSSTVTTARSWSTGRSTRPRRSSAASASSTWPTWTPPIALTKTWPHLELPGVAVEIRPMVEDYSQFE